MLTCCPLLLQHRSQCIAQAVVITMWLFQEDLTLKILSSLEKCNVYFLIVHSFILGKTNLWWEKCFIFQRKVLVQTTFYRSLVYWYILDAVKRRHFWSCLLLHRFMMKLTALICAMQPRLLRIRQFASAFWVLCYFNNWCVSKIEM